MPRPKTEDKMVMVSVHIPRKWLEELDELVAKGLFPSRSEAIRVAIRDLLLKSTRPEEYSEGEFIIGR